ncbi:hypothetical protein [Methyloversatilis sp.]|uniref:hypothetical protein n=1 Tax=Methyloversatilis sp. TaxID=2569862 RepID=UPI0027B9146F|nr:hypothetical protein [Methyloversatilis sp.]
MQATLQLSYNAAVRNAPKIKDIVYDFDSRQFVDAVSGERRDRDSFGDLLDGQGSGAPTRYRGGGATLARAALFNTLVRGQGKEAWAKSVAAIGEQLRGRGIDFELNGIFYSVPSTPAASTFSPAKVRAALVKRFGESGIASLESSGVLQIVPSWDDLPARIRTQGEPDGRAFYDGQQGTAYLIADRLDAGSAASVLLHEIGEHYGLRNMLGDTGYYVLIAKVRAMATTPHSITRTAWKTVKSVRTFAIERPRDTTMPNSVSRWRADSVQPGASSASFAMSTANAFVRLPGMKFTFLMARAQRSSSSVMPHPAKTRPTASPSPSRSPEPARPPFPSRLRARPS